MPRRIDIALKNTRAALDAVLREVYAAAYDAGAEEAIDELLSSAKRRNGRKIVLPAPRKEIARHDKRKLTAQRPGKIRGRLGFREKFILSEIGRTGILRDDLYNRLLENGKRNKYTMNAMRKLFLRHYVREENGGIVITEAGVTLAQRYDIPLDIQNRAVG